LVDVRRFGPGERIVPQPYTKEMFDRTQSWMQGWELLDVTAPASTFYQEAVVS